MVFSVTFCLLLFIMCLFLSCMTLEIGADKFKIPDVLFNLSQVVQVHGLHA